MPNSKKKLTRSRCDAPTLILCAASLKQFFIRLLSSSGFSAKTYEYVNSQTQLERALSSGKIIPELILIDAALTWDEKLFQDFAGFEVAVKIRRDFYVKTPIVFFSTLKKSFFANHSATAKKI